MTQTHLQTHSRETQRPSHPPWTGVLVSTECPPHRQSWTCTHTHTHTHSGHTQLQTQKLKIHITLSNTISLWLAPRAHPQFHPGSIPPRLPRKDARPKQAPCPHPQHAGAQKRWRLKSCFPKALLICKPLMRLSEPPNTTGRAPPAPHPSNYPLDPLQYHFPILYLASSLPDPPIPERPPWRAEQTCSARLLLHPTTKSPGLPVLPPKPQDQDPGASPTCPGRSPRHPYY